MGAPLRTQGEVALATLPDCRNCAMAALGRYGAVHSGSPEMIAEARRSAVTARANALLTRAGERQSQVRMLRRGWAVRVAQLSDGRRQVLNFILPGDLFDLEALL